MRDLEKLVKFGKEIDILYVEDDEALRTELTLILSDIFKSITLAKDGQEGWNKYVDGTFDLIITDIRMPNMNGVEMIENIRKVSNAQSILVTSAHNESEYLVKLINLSVDNFITKPFSSEQIFKVLLKIVTNLHESKELKKYHQELEDINKKLDKVVAKKVKDISEHYIKLQEYQNALDKVSMYFNVDKNGNLIYINKNLCNFLNILNFEEKKYTLDELVSIKNNDLLIACKNLQKWEGRASLKTSDLLKKEVKISTIPFESDENKLLGVVQEIPQPYCDLVQKERVVICEDLSNFPLPALIIDSQGTIQKENNEFSDLLKDITNKKKFKKLRDIFINEEFSEDFETAMLLKNRDAFTLEGEIKTLFDTLSMKIFIKELQGDSFIVTLCHQGAQDVAKQ